MGCNERKWQPLDNNRQYFFSVKVMLELWWLWKVQTGHAWRAQTMCTFFAKANRTERLLDQLSWTLFALLFTIVADGVQQRTAGIVQRHTIKNKRSMNGGLYWKRNEGFEIFGKEVLLVGHSGLFHYGVCHWYLISKKEREGASLAFLQICDPILWYLLNIVKED